MCARHPPDDSAALIKRQQEEIARLRDALTRAERERDRLKRQNDQLKDPPETARHAGFRQVAPFAKAHRQGSGRPPGRRAGAMDGRHGTPPRIEETHAAARPATCPGCGGPVEGTHTVSQYQEDLPAVRPVIREFRVHIGTCTPCRRRVQGRHSAADVGRARRGSGADRPRGRPLVVVLHKGLGLPLGHVVTLLRDQFGLRGTHGALVHVCARAADL